jgi:hypothetical protein
VRPAFALSAARQSLPLIACPPRPAAFELDAAMRGRFGVVTMEGAAA